MLANNVSFMVLTNLSITTDKVEKEYIIIAKRWLEFEKIKMKIKHEYYFSTES